MAGAPPTVYVHIGLAKTGTTYLQQLMWENRESLAKAGLLYPGRRRTEHFLAAVDLRADPSPRAPGSLQPGTWDALVEEAHSAPDRAVISHEWLARATTAQAQRAVSSLEPAEVHLIVTMRDLARLLPALWQELVKNGRVLTYADFLGKLSRGLDHFPAGQNVMGVLSRWDAVPPERVHVVTVPRPGTDRDLLWERFALVMGVDPAVATIPTERTNDSLSVVESELLRRLNPALKKRFAGPAYYRVVKDRFVAEVLAGTSPHPRLKVPVEHRDWMTERAQEMIDGLASGGFDIVGDLADLKPEFGDPVVADPADVTDRQLWELAAQCLVTVVGDNHDRRRKAGRARRRRVPRVARRLPRRVARRLPPDVRSRMRSGVRRVRGAMKPS
ncbi:MAG: hypothetical protein GEU93_08740 [Propionibacteriales bacterium]|nr:hypothetical protein [Propionibacteriales bacterium]